MDKLVREGNKRVKKAFELLLQEKEFHTVIDEQIAFDQLEGSAHNV